MGGKQNNLFGAYGCVACHNEVDGRTQKILERLKVRAWFLDGVIRTQQILLDEGVIKT
jgi:hypothetical protein